MREDLNFLTTAIGSLPHTNQKDAVDLVFKTIPNAPCCPQLSKVNPNEDMLIQYTEHLAGIKPDATAGKQFVDLESDEYFEQLEELFTDYEELISSDNLSNEILSKYAISEKCSSAFPYFLEKVKETKPKFIKGQVVGAFTLGTSLSDQNNKCSFYDETYREVIIKTLILKALWQVNEFRKVSKSSKNIIFLDEPSMSQLGTSAFLTVTKQDIKDMISQITGVLHKYNILVGIHCCGKADWSILLETDLDIINFDTFFFADNFALYHKEIANFLNKNGIIAWGVVPTLDVEALENTDVNKLTYVFKNAVKLLTDKGIDEQKILKSSIITPSCGAGSLSVDNAQRAMELLKSLSDNLKECNQ